MLIFASQDGLTKVLVKDFPVAQLVMMRYWVFVVFLPSDMPPTKVGAKSHFAVSTLGSKSFERC